jgi:hypothetical protein
VGQKGSDAVNEIFRITDRFMAKVKKIEAGCWEWSSSIDPSGYGKITFDGKQLLAHRVSYAIYQGQIPDGMMVLHRCDNRSCVNPDHLFLGTGKDNMVDCAAKGRAVRANAMKTHCPKGHELSGENLYFDPHGVGSRRCRTCMKARCRRYYERTKKGAKNG